MSKQYKALKPIGRFEKGDFVGGLSEAEIKQHLAAGNITEVKQAAATTKPVKEGKTNVE